MNINNSSRAQRRIEERLFRSGRTLDFAALASPATDVNQMKGKTNMKLTAKIILTALTLSGTAATLQAQDVGDPGPGPGPGHRPPPPVIAALDANQDGVIDANEISNAPNALRSLDNNGDGQLTQDELRPPRPEGRGPGGPGGEGQRPPRPQRSN